MKTRAATHRAGIPNERRQVVRRLLSHNVRLFLYDGDVAKKSASGVVIGSEVGAGGSASYIVTNAHALDTRGMTAPEVRVVVERPWEDARAEAMEFNATLAAVGKIPEMDLALLRVDGITLDAAPLAENDDLVPGDAVVVAAAPYGKAVSLSGGLVSYVEWDRKSGEPVMVKTDAAIGYGASGGGVYSLESGKLLAIVEGYRTAKVGFNVQAERYSFDVPMPGETFAAPAAKVRQFLAQKGFARLLSKDAPKVRAASR